MTISLLTETERVIVEPVITGLGQTRPEQTEITELNGQVSLELTHTPIDIFADSD